MSIRLRLTLLYSIILALTLVAFSGVLYATQSRYTLNIVKNDLSMNAGRVVELWSRSARGLDRSPFPWTSRKDGTEEERGFLITQPLVLREVRVRGTIRLLDTDGIPFDISINQESQELPLSQEGLAQLQNGQSWIEITSGEEGRSLIYSQPAEVDGEIIGIVQVARTLADRDRSLRALGLALILGSLLTITVAFGIGWLLAGITLRPIHRITQTAQQIGQTRDFSRRIEHKGPNDELGRLASTFNDMLSHLQDAFQQIAHALQVQRDFVTDVSHELRTPLTTIRGNLALLHREPPILRTEREDILRDLTGESERLIRLVTDLLTLARADAGRKLASDRVPVQQLVDDVCRQARLLQPGREIECNALHPVVSQGMLTRSGANGVHDIMALADHDALKQVLLILLDNAVSHAEKGIRVTVAQKDQQVTISVQDSGPGMPHELCERIFDRFYRGDASRSTPGFGLGLSIAKALVEAQGGTIEVESQIGQGSTFTVALPTP